MTTIGACVKWQSLSFDDISKHPMLPKLAKRPESVPVISTLLDLCSVLRCRHLHIEEICSNVGAFYNHFQVLKKNGQPRDIYSPRYRLKKFQQLLLGYFYKHALIPRYLYGGIPGRSIVKHARRHVRRRMVATFDVRDFYPSTTISHVALVLKELGFRDEALMAVAIMTTLNGALPQGAPTSCLLANLALTPADERIMRMCRKNAFQYSRFVDDMALSGDADLRRWNGAVIDSVRSAGFELASDKTHFFWRSERQVVTGLVVNDHLRPTRGFLRTLKKRIRQCLESGADRVAMIEGIPKTLLRQQINGQVSYVCQVDPELGKQLRGPLYAIAW